MTHIEQYTVSIIIVALLTGVICGITETAFSSELIKLICSVLIAFTLVRPLLNIKLADFSNQLESCAEDADYYSEQGNKMVQKEVALIIKERIEAYILEKADYFQSELSVDVFLENQIPVQVTLEGTISPYGKEQLSTILEEELGIARENQLWT